MEDLVGKYAKIKFGLFSDLVARIDRAEDELDMALGLYPYKLVFPSGMETRLVSKEYVEILDDFTLEMHDNIK